MFDLETQLRDYFDHVVERVGVDDVLVEEVGTESVRPLRVRFPRRRVPGWVYGLAVAAATVILIGGVALLTGGPSGDRSPVATQPTLTTIPVTRDLFPIRLGDETVTGCCGWGIVSVDDPRLLAEGVALVVHPTFMAYTMGYLDDRFDDLWISGDGTTWEQVILPGMLSEQGELVEAELIAKTSDVAVGGPGLVAVGYGLPHPECETFPIPGVVEPGLEAPPETSMEGCIPQGTQHGVVWTSPDGRIWTKLPADPVFDGADIHGVASDGNSLVAVGFHHEIGINIAGDFYGHSVVWTSPNGITWKRLPHNQELLGDSVMHRFEHGPAGYLAVGWALPRNDLQESIYWLSPDGREWTRVKLPDELLDTLPTMLLADDGGYYVSVAYRDGDGPDWTSPDGITWTPLPPGSFPTP